MLIPLVASCGGGSSKPKPDAGPDAPPVCTPSTVTAGTPVFQAGDTMSVSWAGPVTGMTSDGNMLQFSDQFYSGIEMAGLSGTFALDSGNQMNYSSCALCFLAFTTATDAMGNPLHIFFQSGGSVTLSEDPFTRQHMMGSVSNLTMTEVTIDPNTFASTPVPGGLCVTFGNETLNADNVPPAWTCDHAKWMDGTQCDCMCGAQDPDCDNHMNTVNGCTTGQVCFGGNCATPPANDTCTTALPLVLATPVMGNTAGGNNDYSMGLETCTAVQGGQNGPDVAYHIALTAGTSYTFTLSNVDAAYDASISLVGPGTAAVCSANITTCVAGADANAEGMGETFQYTVPTGGTGTYYVIVDSFYSNEGGAFTLTVTSP